MSYGHLGEEWSLLSTTFGDKGTLQFVVVTTRSTNLCDFQKIDEA